MSTKRILIAYDGTEQSFWALEQAAAAAQADDVEIGVVTVLPRIVDAPGEALRYLFEHGIDAQVHTPVGEDPVGEISRLVAQHGYDDVYVGRRGDRFAGGFRHSVSRGVEEFADGNVLIAR
jgi:nucleotide-binding universal stress UspA family protein